MMMSRPWSAKRAEKITELSFLILDEDGQNPSFFYFPQKKAVPPFSGTAWLFEDQLEEAADEVFRDFAGFFHVAEAEDFAAIVGVLHALELIEFVVPAIRVVLVETWGQ
jgi:hypothetical protein